MLKFVALCVALLVPTFAMAQFASFMVNGAGVFAPPPPLTPVVQNISPTSGLAAGGTPVVISGTNLATATGPNGVQFGGVNAASYTVNSPSAGQITANSPPGTAGNVVHVQVTTPVGTSAATSADQFTYGAPAPVVSSVTPNVGPTSGLTSVTITGSNFTGVSAVTFGTQQNAQSFQFISATQITAVSPSAVAGTVDVQVTTPGGISAVNTSGCPLATPCDQFTFAPGNALDPVNIGAANTLSNSNLTVTQSGTGSCTTSEYCSARTVLANSTGKYYFEAQGVTGGVVTLGIGSGTQLLTNTNCGGNAGDTTCLRYYGLSQGFWSFNGNSANAAPINNAGDQVGMAVDFGNKTAWVRVNGGQWNGSPTANPATNTGGQSFSGNTGLPWYVIVLQWGGHVGWGTLMNFGASPGYAYPAPSGFVNWDGSTPPTGGPPAISSLSVNSGAAGTAVTINGNNFNGATGAAAVQFGGINVSSYTVVSNTQITTTSPAGSGVVNVNVTTPSGTSANTSINTYTYPTAATNAPIITGATFRPVTSSTITSGTTIGTLSVNANGGTMSSCAIAGGDTASLFTISLVSGNCRLAMATGKSLASGSAGFENLTISATNTGCTGCGTGVAIPVSVQWKAWTSTTPNIIPPGTINTLVPNGTPFSSSTIMGRVGTDTTAGAPALSSCAITNQTNAGQFTALATVGYHCQIKPTSTLPASGTTNLTMTATNSNGTGAAQSFTLNWSTVAAGAPVVSQANFSVTTPVNAGAIVGTVPATNGPTTCTITSGDPGQPQPYFSIAPISGGCQIKINASGPATLSGSLGSPILYVTAANASGTALGNYVVVAMGPSSGPGSGSAAASAATAAGYTNLVINDVSPMSLSMFDTTDSHIPFPGIHWYGDPHSYSGPFNCDGGSCDYADLPSMFDPSPIDQAGDNQSGKGVTINASHQAVITPSTGGNHLMSCTQFGKEPNNTQFPIIGHAYANGFFLDIAASSPTNAGPQSPVLWSHPVQSRMNGFLPTVGSNYVEFDIPEWDNGAYSLIWTYGSASFSSSTQMGPRPAINAVHHYQFLWQPHVGATNGSFTYYVDGVAATGFTNPISYSSASGFAGADSSFQCFFLGPGWVGGTTVYPLTVQSVQIWQHP